MLDDKAYLNFSYTDVDSKTTSISVPLQWDTNWVEIINHIALALECAGFYDVRKRIKVTTFDYYYNKEEPDFISLTEYMENR